MNTDIDKQLAQMGIHTRFEQSGVETFTLARDDGTSYLVTLLRDPDGIRLHLTVRCSQPLPDALTRHLFLHLAHQALEPMRGGDGIGIYPDSDCLALYRTRDLRTPVPLAEEIAYMLGQAEQWDSRLLEARSRLEPPSYPLPEGLTLQLTIERCIIESLSQFARVQLSQQLSTQQEQQVPASLTLNAKGNNGFSHTYTVEQYHADVSRNYLFGASSSDDKTSRALATYIQSRLPSPQRQQPLTLPRLQQVQPPLPNQQTQRQQTVDQLFPPLPPRNDDEDRALRDTRYQRDRHQAAFLAIQPAPPNANPTSNAVKRLTSGFIKSDYHREGTKQLGNLFRQGYYISVVV